MSILSTELLKLYWQQQQGGVSPLPEGYTPVSYIEASGEQWIDTGVVVDDESFETSFDFSVTNSFQYGNASFIFGLAAKNGKYSCSLPASTAIRCPNGNAFENYTVPVLGLTRHNMHYAYGQIKVDNNIVSTAMYPMDNRYPGNTLWIFGRHGEPNVETEYIVGAGFRCYTFVQRKQQSTVRNYIPCVRVADNKPGMYDACGNEIVPLDGPSPSVGAEICYLCEWSALQGQWTIMPIGKGGAQ